MRNREPLDGNQDFSLEVTVTVTLDHRSTAKNIYRSLSPESSVRPYSRNIVELSQLNSKIGIFIKARDFTSLNASLNSYIRWIAMLNGICSDIQ